MAVLALSEYVDLAGGLGGKSPGLGDHLEEGGRSDQLIVARFADGPEHRHFLIFPDEHGHVGGLGVFLVEQRSQPLFQFLGGETLDFDFPEQRQADRAVLGDPDGLVQLGELENLDFQEVLGPDLVVDGLGVHVFLGVGCPGQEQEQGRRKKHKAGRTERSSG